MESLMERIEEIDSSSSDFTQLFSKVLIWINFVKFISIVHTLSLLSWIFSFWTSILYKEAVINLIRYFLCYQESILLFILLSVDTATISFA